MKKIALATAAATLLFAGSASAADLAARPYTKAPMAAPIAVYNWTGFYVGGQVGYGWRDDDNVERVLATGLPDGWRANSQPSGVVGGVHAGYNWQAGMFVLGVEGDVEGSDVNGTGFYRLNGGAPILDRVDSSTDWQASIRGRVGIAANNWLLYGTAGAAFTTINHTYVSVVGGNGALSFNNSLTGWTAGAGVEYGFTPNWSARVEYRYTDYGTVTNNVGTLFGAAATLQDQHITDSTVRGGISYRFGGPIVARY
jgi:outer membrane immunogenic protein